MIERNMLVHIFLQIQHVREHCYGRVPSCHFESRARQFYYRIWLGCRHLARLRKQKVQEPQLAQV